MPGLRITLLACALLATTAQAGPPYFTDDPTPTDERHYEIYGFADGLHNTGGSS